MEHDWSMIVSISFWRDIPATMHSYVHMLRYAQSAHVFYANRRLLHGGQHIDGIYHRSHKKKILHHKSIIISSCPQSILSMHQRVEKRLQSHVRWCRKCDFQFWDQVARRQASPQAHVRQARLHVFENSYCRRCLIDRCSTTFVFMRNDKNKRTTLPKRGTLNLLPMPSAIFEVPSVNDRRVASG